MCSISREPRRDDQTTCTAAAPDLGQVAGRDWGNDSPPGPACLSSEQLFVLTRTDVGGQPGSVLGCDIDAVQGFRNDLGDLCLVDGFGSLAAVAIENPF
jgi:hypothetical protein